MANSRIIPTPAHSSRTPHRPLNRGFTLLELLAVVTVTCILVALLFPAFGAFQKRAKAAKCAANLKAIGGAIFAYTADSNGYILPRYADDVADGLKGWPRRLLKLGYLDNPEVLFCPSFFPINNEQAIHKPFLKDASQTYGMRVWSLPGRKYTADNTQVHKPLAAIQKPADFFLVADSVWTSEGWLSQGYGITASKGVSKQLVHLRHAKLANTLFADGHVEQMPGSYFADLNGPGGQAEYSEGPAYQFSSTEDTKFQP
jgi:prepilin-type N-terminal cleavage/methylation domain-containing protein/prepilin-type processing-associated H-X9-DG protein